MIDRITAALSRRNLLLGLAASATAAAATGTDAATAPQENPDLLAMADALPAVRAEYVTARDDRLAILAKWSPQWPVPDERIIRYGEGCRTYRGLDGRGIELPWGKGGLAKVPSLGTPEYFEASAAHHEKEAARRAATSSKRRLKFSTGWAEHDRAAIEPARAFWSEVGRITEASGIEAATVRCDKAEDALKTAVDQIMVADDWTITGAIIKAQALNAWGDVDRFSRAFNDRGPAWADLLAASIVKHAK